MIKTEEQRRGQRYNVRLPLRIVALDGIAVNWTGQTRDLGTGGVRFLIRSALPVGKPVEYVVTLSTYSPAAHIRCIGAVLRCATYDGTSSEGLYDIAVTMNSYSFVPPYQAEYAAMTPGSGGGSGVPRSADLRP